jgi:hypothetical protein
MPGLRSRVQAKNKGENPSKGKGETIKVAKEAGKAKASGENPKRGGLTRAIADKKTVKTAPAKPAPTLTPTQSPTMQKRGSMKSKSIAKTKKR